MLAINSKACILTCYIFKKGHGFLKLIKTKILTIISGFLTLSGLAMLFSGLIIQMDESTNFNSEQAIAAHTSTNAIIFLGVIIAIGFGVAFFNYWAKSRNTRKHEHKVKFV